MKTKLNFNMIEILLALGLTAIGITGLMGIIPLALNANRDAMAETYTADIANTFFAQINLDCASRKGEFVIAEGEKTAEGKKAAKEDVWKNICYPFQLVSSSLIRPEGASGESYKCYVNPNESGKITTWIPEPVTLAYEGINYKKVRFNDTDYYQIRVGKKGSSVLPDFTADLCGWYCFPDDIIGTADDATQRDFVRVYLEVSWPVIAPYENREKRLFVREFYNKNVLALEE